MNKYEHAENSVKIFGGKPEDYEEIHALIDNNKVVTPSIFGRFFLHHYDVGKLILEKVFGEKVGSKKVSTRKILIQHLFEDYDQVLTFKDHWMPALKENERHLPRLDEWSSFVAKAKNDTRLKNLTEQYLVELDNFFTLGVFGDELRTREYPAGLSIAVLGHALGADVVAKMIGKKFHGLWANDVVTGYLNCRFAWTDLNRDPVPTLLDYEHYVPDKPWMHAPAGYDDTQRKDPKAIKAKIDKYCGPIEFSKKSIAGKIRIPRHLSEGFHRKPCNFD